MYVVTSAPPHVAAKNEIAVAEQNPILQQQNQQNCDTSCTERTLKTVESGCERIELLRNAQAVSSQERAEVHNTDEQELDREHAWLLEKEQTINCEMTEKGLNEAGLAEEETGRIRARHQNEIKKRNSNSATRFCP